MGQHHQGWAKINISDALYLKEAKNIAFASPSSAVGYLMTQPLLVLEKRKQGTNPNNWRRHGKRKGGSLPGGAFPLSAGMDGWLPASSMTKHAAVSEQEVIYKLGKHFHLGANGLVYTAKQVQPPHLLLNHECF